MGCWQGGEALPTPQVFHPNLADLNIPHSGSAWTDRYPPTLLYAAPHQYKTTDWEDTTFLHLGREIPQCQHRSPISVASGQGLAVTLGCVTTGSEEHPEQPCTGAPSGVKNKGKGEHSHPCQHTAFSLVLL